MGFLFISQGSLGPPGVPGLDGLKVSSYKQKVYVYIVQVSVSSVFSNIFSGTFDDFPFRVSTALSNKLLF